MGGDAYLFLLVPGATLAQNTFPSPKDSEGYQYIHDQLGKPPTSVKKIGCRPKVIYYPNINDPLNPKEITPESIADVLGEGYSYDDVTIEITKDPVTKVGIRSIIDQEFKTKRVQFLRTTSVTRLVNGFDEDGLNVRLIGELDLGKYIRVQE
jgi:hypothetical protein